LRIFGDEVECRERDRGRRAAPDGLDVEAPQRAARRPGLVGGEEAMLAVDDDGRGLDAPQPRAALERGLERGRAFEQRQDLLRLRLARQRPQARAAAAGKDDGMEFHR
jgi:hypothetical protein